MSLVISCSLRRLRHRVTHTNVVDGHARRVFVDAPLDLGAEMAQQSLYRPSRAVAERADGMALDLLGDLHQHVDLAVGGATLRHASEHAPHPAHAFATRRALPAGLVLVEI